MGQHTATVLRHGFTLTEVEQLARRAARAPMAICVDPDDAYETCWGAIVEHLYTTARRPGAGWLLRTAHFALGKLVYDERRHRGKVCDQRQNRARFFCYWDWAARTTPSPEPPVVERAALAQIWAALRPIDRATFEALAQYGDHAAAAAALGLRPNAYANRLALARRRFLRLWHQGETPSRLWRADYRDRQANRRIALAHRREVCGCAACTAARAKAQRTTAVRELPVAVVA
jgi:hypothetical protein